MGNYHRTARGGDTLLDGEIERERGREREGEKERESSQTRSA
jgi:hypothetical protein